MNKQERAGEHLPFPSIISSGGKKWTEFKRNVLLMLDTAYFLNVWNENIGENNRYYYSK